MVCKKCEKKTSVAGTSSGAGATGVRKIGENKLLSARAKAAPYAKPGVSRSKTNPYGNKCIDCKQQVHQNNATRCQKCAYKKGLCAICGNIVLDTSRGLSSWPAPLTTQGTSRRQSNPKHRASSTTPAQTSNPSLNTQRSSLLVPTLSLYVV
ncbi:hypothetical protein VHUM_01887 [Vanrija humicola]|uniref:Cysteine-rich PDZ-binding protein n=1 Tax=Vanrija humicola TaxID=5417 RepID=A0A7D8Z1C0_VANHU|nr:hypothetical protein VHUM_01887 [Vanrija humicola]